VVNIVLIITAAILSFLRNRKLKKEKEQRYKKRLESLTKTNNLTNVTLFYEQKKEE